MLANIIIMILILGYCAFIIYKSVKNTKEGKHTGCAGCSGNCGSCGGGCGSHTTGGTDMGNSTGSTMYMFGAVIVIYIVGMLIYQGVQWIKKKREQKKDEEFRRGDK